MQFNLIHKSNPETDKELFFGPLDNDKFIVFDTETNISELLVLVRKFKSKSQAKKNGFDIEIPLGFSHFKIGKNKNRIDLFIMNKEK